MIANENDTVEVGKVIARIETEGEAEAAQPAEETPPAAEKEEPASVEEPAPAPTQSAPEPADVKEEKKIESTKFFSPVVLNIARTEGVSAEELESIEGTGISGRVTKKDILNYVEAKKAGTAAPAAASTAPAAVIWQMCR